jgi:hypothetical protein
VCLPHHNPQFPISATGSHSTEGLPVEQDQRDPLSATARPYGFPSLALAPVTDVSSLPQVRHHRPRSSRLALGPKGLKARGSYTPRFFLAASACFAKDLGLETYGREGRLLGALRGTLRVFEGRAEVIPARSHSRLNHGAFPAIEDEA